MKPEIDLKDYESGFARFDSLMPYKVLDILVVSSLYDSFILEEDGHISQLFFREYAQLNLTFTPHIRRVSRGTEALELLETQKFDMIIVFRQLSDMDIISFGMEAKKIIPDIPVVLLAFHPRELEVAESEDYYRALDKAFIWSGEADILPAIVKYIEDKRNVDFDTRLVGVRVIIVIEDSVRFYSAYLPQIFTEIMHQTQALMSDSLNMTHKILRMRARPKILLTDTFEDAWHLFEKYQKYLLGVISDIRFMKDGRPNDGAGLELAQEVKEKAPDLPILLQSSNPANAELAGKYGISFLHKKSPTLLADLRNFIMQNFGFGDFVFRLADGTEVGRATDFHSMEKCLATVPEESLIYHGNRNHFSNWLMARTEFDLAVRLRPRKVSEFKDLKTLRGYLVKTFRSFRHEKQLGIVSDFSRKQFDLQTDFVRIGDGSLGGKGRGLAFINRLLRRYNVYDCFDGVRITVPPSAIISTSVYDEFLEKNKLLEFALGDKSDEEIASAFFKARLPKGIITDLKSFLDVVKYPIAVRSSSLLEDSHYQPFAGIFDTHMLANCHRDRKARLDRVEAAIKYIYASTFFRKSKSYIEATGNRPEEEKMAVILQKVVGKKRGDSFYPVLSGIARSYDFYSIGNIRPEEGVVYAALGLGKTVVDGGKCLYFSPNNPQSLPQFSTPKDFLENSQKDFYAVDMSRPDAYPHPGGEMGLVRSAIDRADADGTLAFVGSTYSADNDRVYDGTARKGIRIVTFAPILKSKIFPLDELLRFLLQLGSSGMNCPVEIEFAAELSEDRKRPHEFGFLQIRPMALETALGSLTFSEIEKDRIVCRSNQTLSHGKITGIKDIVYVRTDSFDRSKMPEMAAQIGEFNAMFKKRGKPYMLVGPGRWGTADRWLGIPITWDQISSVQVIIEAKYGDFSVTPSFGTHFYQNLIAFQIGYLTIEKTDENNFIDWGWLNSRTVARETTFIRHVTLDSPIEVLINGRDGHGIILKP
ncbi:MAG: histidine kinase [Candidatus Zixiibacteriota bacterium]|nr:MAG: histidine kinase [candidate division Zixibacteria bacterium]